MTEENYGKRSRMDKFVRDASEGIESMPNYESLDHIFEYLESEFPGGSGVGVDSELERTADLLETLVWYMVEPPKSASREKRTRIKSEVSDPVKPEAKKGNYSELRDFVSYLEDVVVKGIADEVKR